VLPILKTSVLTSQIVKECLQRTKAEEDETLMHH